MLVPAVPDHDLLRCIGRGAYGAVWLARNVMGTFRAVKIVHREDFSRDRPFTREYEGLLKFEPISRSHPNLMQILHVGRHDSYFYYVTELADDAGRAELGGASSQIGDQASGSKAPVEAERTQTTERSSGAAPVRVDSYVPRTLQQDLERRGRLPVRECVALATALASALKYLHDRELVHRDVKPSNVIFVHGIPKLADIGLVTAVGDSRSIVGTEGYLPPEGPGNPQADLYALVIAGGAVWVWRLTDGRWPPTRQEPDSNDRDYDRAEAPPRGTLAAPLLTGEPVRMEACLVRLSELHADGQVFTLDRHFRRHRRHGRRVIRLLAPR